MIGTWNPQEAASVPTWNPYGRIPTASSGINGINKESGAEKPPEEALPHISFDVPEMGTVRDSQGVGVVGVDFLGWPGN